MLLYHRQNSKDQLEYVIKVGISEIVIDRRSFNLHLMSLCKLSRLHHANDMDFESNYEDFDSSLPTIIPYRNGC